VLPAAVACEPSLLAFEGGPESADRLFSPERRFNWIGEYLEAESDGSIFFSVFASKLAHIKSSICPSKHPHSHARLLTKPASSGININDFNS
jgi:hypothetical protein